MCSVPMKLCPNRPASSCANTKTFRAWSVKRSNTTDRSPVGRRATRRGVTNCRRLVVQSACCLYRHLRLLAGSSWPTGVVMPSSDVPSGRS